MESILTVGIGGSDEALVTAVVAVLAVVDVVLVAVLVGVLLLFPEKRYELVIGYDGIDLCYQNQIDVEPT